MRRRRFLALAAVLLVLSVLHVLVDWRFGVLAVAVAVVGVA